ncbi:unnamed protein product, partial [Musa acuminata subsp. burmannicoides]
LHVLQAAVRLGLDEPNALASASDTNLAAAVGIVREPPREGVVLHQRLRQSLPDDPGRLPAVPKHVERPHHIPEDGLPVDKGEAERAPRRLLSWSDEGPACSGHSKAH